MSVRLYERFDAGEMAKDLEAGKGTIVSLVAKMLTDLLPLVPQQGFDSLRYILLGGGPIAKSVLKMPAKSAFCDSILWDDRNLFTSGGIAARKSF